MPEVEVERRTAKGKAAVATCKPALQACKTKLTRRVIILYEIMNCAQPFHVNQITDCWIETLSRLRTRNPKASATLLPNQLFCRDFIRT
ncbi:unnamed protein product [Urochloa humidicola]